MMIDKKEEKIKENQNIQTTIEKLQEIQEKKS